jgi:hypothetical protein
MRLLEEKLAAAIELADKDEAAGNNILQLASDARKLNLLTREGIKKLRATAAAETLTHSLTTARLAALEAAGVALEARTSAIVADGCKAWVDGGHGTADDFHADYVELCDRQRARYAAAAPASPGDFMLLGDAD